LENDSILHKTAIPINPTKYPLLCEKVNQKYIHYTPELYNFEDETVERGLKELYEETPRSANH